MDFVIVINYKVLHDVTADFIGLMIKLIFYNQDLRWIVKGDLRSQKISFIISPMKSVSEANPY